MKNILYNNYVIDPSSELTPVIRIAPFRNIHLQKELFSRKRMKISSDYLSDRFHNYQLVQKGRSAISIALSSFNLSKEDVVTVLTTSGYFYISSCVTKEIEKYCRWSREFMPQAKVIFVNHEFGCQSTEQMGNLLNESLIFQKEGFGGREMCYDIYEYEL